MALDLESATIGALGELLERYSSGIYNNNEFLIASFNDIHKKGKNVLPTDKIRYFSNKQYLQFKSENIHPLNDSDVIEWVKSYNIITKEEIYIPAYSIYMPYISKYDSRKEFAKLSTSTGLAAGKNLKNAITSGLFECIERDAFSKFWYKQDSIKLIQYSPEQIINAFKDNSIIKSLLDNPGVKISIFDLSEISIAETIVTFMFFNYKGFSYMTLGASASLSKEQAIIKSAIEAYQGVEYTLSLKDSNILSEEIIDFNKIDSFSKHFFFYNRFPEYKIKSKILFAAEHNNTYSKKIIPAKFDSNDNIFNKNTQSKLGLNYIIYKDITPIDVDQLGYSIARVVTPELNLLSGKFKYPFLGGNFKDDGQLFVSLPHPFP